MQLALVLWFGFVKDGGVAAMLAGMLAHLFTGSWMIAHVFYDLSCLRAYAGSRCFAQEMP